MLGRLLAGVLIGATAIPLVAAPAAAAPPPAVTVTPAGPDSHVVTLITGDTVRLTEAAEGRYAATVTPAPGRESVGFHTYQGDGGLRVVPEDAIPLIGAGRVDADLFDVERLISQGYGDADTDTLPLIVRGGDAGMRAAGAPLTAIGATAIAPAKTALAGFWKERTGARTASATTIYLDGRVRAALDRSTAQVGAPAAWAKGLDGRGVTVAVLDTGVDATHPDLDGRIAGARNFSDSPDVTDRHGHGTHVASTVAGTGAASGGDRRGVAPGASLLIGKVLGDDGYGRESDIIAAMQWAAGAGARVVNLSLGGEPTDGLDPMSLAVDELSESTGALFVIAAGNSGENGDSTVGTPGSAARALTVGAVGRDDALASFSSRGPRAGDLALKPEITAPGVAIVAARAAGTAMDTPVDAHYTAASGTSMATPHVAGAAAILAQQHPDWSGPRIKEALVSTARTAPGASVYGQGAGRLDLARATTQTVTGSPVADFGRQTVSSPAAARTVTYANAGPAPVTLTLAAPSFATAPATVTVAAGGTAAVTVTVAAGGRRPGRLSGWLTATAPGGVVVTTAVGAVVDGPVHRVTIKAVGRDGAPAFVPALTVFGDDSRFDHLLAADRDGVTVSLQEGTYLLTATIEPARQTMDDFVAIPELRVTGDTTVLLDARRGTPIRIETPRPAVPTAITSYYVHRVTETGRSLAHGVMRFSGTTDIRVSPTPRVTTGSFEFSSRWQLAAPRVRASADGVGEVAAYLVDRSPADGGTRRFPLAAWGAASVRGRAVLVADDGSGDLSRYAAAGAAAVVLIQEPGVDPWTGWDPSAAERLPLPAIAVSHEDGRRLLRRPVALDLTLTVSSPYLYDVMQVSPDRIPERITHRVTTANTHRITTRYAHNGGLDWIREQRFGWRPWQEYAWNDTSRIARTPSVREEWVSAGDSLWQHLVHHAYPWNGIGALQDGFTGPVTAYRPGTGEETWAAPVVRPADVSSRRDGDVLRLRVAEFVDGDGHHTGAYPGESTAALWRDGVKVADLPTGAQDVTTTPGRSAYQLRVTTERGGEDWRYGTRTDTEWGFTSATGTGDLPLLGVDYDPGPLGVRLDFTAPLSSLTAEFSTDEGRTWRRTVTLGGLALIPRGGREPVSLRVTARDTAGNTLTQTVIRAF
ncbi:S8 family peptidase [Catenuloplanes atrovinosus]|uniref:Subtilisin family serine protease n=1 Tax=Catenuloplanes atrovinosus TaxID=137266 RepID=A0AAE4C978_9ACTN|nr:S8 family peptidase [Catenuloplanes atrovinosus]MDR7275472.1 subtilisin family serine protease [Catenuloplanes atrovinosus]